jgi:hypothetical protein
MLVQDKLSVEGGKREATVIAVQDRRGCKGRRQQDCAADAELVDG